MLDYEIVSEKSDSAAHNLSLDDNTKTPEIDSEGYEIHID